MSKSFWVQDPLKISLIPPKKTSKLLNDKEMEARDYLFFFNPIMRGETKNLDTAGS